MYASPTILRAARLCFLVAATTTGWCLPAHAIRAGAGTDLPRAAALDTQATVSRQVRIIDFTRLTSAAAIVFRYTRLAPGAAGQAEIVPAGAWLKIHGMFSNVPAASRLGSEDLTYTLWQVTPDGRATNLGEIEISGSNGEIHTKSRAHQFGLIVTAEPYFAVSQPSAAVAFESDLTPGSTLGEPLAQATCELLTAPIGSKLVASDTGGAPDPKTTGEPLLFEEARRALAVARASGAAEYAPGTLATAEQTLQIARTLVGQRAKPAEVHDAALEAVLIAEDARVLAVVRRKRAQATRVDRGSAP